MANRINLNATSYHGAGAIAEIANEAKAHGFKKAFVCSDPDLIKFNVTSKVTDILTANGLDYELYSDIKPNPTIENVKHGVEAFKASGADYLIAIGGGSSMDTSKAIGIIIANPEFEDVRSLEGTAPTKNPCVPIIAVPTTAGTAAEVTINYVITDVEKKRKFVCVDTHDIPVVAVVDPEMMSTMPAGLTAATGMDALTHAIEGYITKGAWELSDMFHIKAIEIIARSLRGAVKNTPDFRRGIAPHDGVLAVTPDGGGKLVVSRLLLPRNVGKGGDVEHLDSHVLVPLSYLFVYTESSCSPGLVNDRHRRGGIAEDAFAANHHAPDGFAVARAALANQLDRHAAHRGAIDTEGCQRRRVSSGRAEIIEAHDGNVLRHAVAAALQVGNQRLRGHIAVHDERSRHFLRQLEGVEHAPFRVAVGKNAFGAHGQILHQHCGKETEVAFHDGGRCLDIPDEADVPMPLLNQPVGQLRRAESVVADNGVSGDKGVVEVQTDDGHFLPRQQLHIRGG